METHWAVTWTSCLSCPESDVLSGRLIEQLCRQVVQVSHCGHLARSHYQAVTQTSCLTSPKNGVLSDRHIKHLPRTSCLASPSVSSGETHQAVTLTICPCMCGHAPTE